MACLLLSASFISNSKGECFAKSGLNSAVHGTQLRILAKNPINSFLSCKTIDIVH